MDSSVFDAHAIILAGGRGKRMGTDKTALKIGDETLVERLIRVLAPLFKGVLVGTSRSLSDPIQEVRYISDRKPGMGPLMAIYSCLEASPSPVNFVVACDIPEVNISLIRHLLSFAEEYEIVTPSFRQGFPEPLFAVYNRSVLPVLKKQLDTDQLKTSNCLQQCNTKIVPIKDDTWYHNLNTPQDYTIYMEKRKRDLYE